MSGTSEKRHQPTGRLVLAVPTGVYLAVYLAPDNGWQTSGAVGGGMCLFILTAPWLLKALGKLLAGLWRLLDTKKKSKKNDGKKK